MYNSETCIYQTLNKIESCLYLTVNDITMHNVFVCLFDGVSTIFQLYHGGLVLLVEETG